MLFSHSRQTHGQEAELRNRVKGCCGWLEPWCIAAVLDKSGSLLSLLPSYCASPEPQLYKPHLLCFSLVDS